MPRGSPAIACIGIIGRKVYHNKQSAIDLLTHISQDEPLHIAIIPNITPTVPARTTLDYHKHLFSALDIFETRNPDTPDGNYNLLFAIDTRLAFFGWITPTNIKYIIGVDMEGKSAPEQAALEGGTAKSTPQQPNGIRYAELAPAFGALRKAYARLLRDPFYLADEEEEEEVERGGSGKVRNRWFESEVVRVGESWYPGIAAL